MGLGVVNDFYFGGLKHRPKKRHFLRGLLGERPFRVWSVPPLIVFGNLPLQLGINVPGLLICVHFDVMCAPSRQNLQYLR